MRVTAIAMALTLAAGAAAAEDAKGVWKTAEKDDGRYLHVEVAPCAEAAATLCGTAIGAFGGAKESVVGKRIFWDMAPDGAGMWADGEIWAPDDDKTYSGELELKGAVLEVSGCVLGGLICRGQDWTRVAE